MQGKLQQAMNDGCARKLFFLFTKKKKKKKIRPDYGLIFFTLVVVIQRERSYV